jgi:hypothetical protein
MIEARRSCSPKRLGKGEQAGGQVQEVTKMWKLQQQDGFANPGT